MKLYFLLKKRKYNTDGMILYGTAKAMSDIFTLINTPKHVIYSTT